MVREDISARIESGRAGEAIPRLLGLDESVFSEAEYDRLWAETVDGLRNELLEHVDAERWEQAVARYRSLASVAAYLRDAEPAPEPAPEPEIDDDAVATEVTDSEESDTVNNDGNDGNDGDDGEPPIRAAEFSGRYSERPHSFDAGGWALNDLYLEWADSYRRDNNAVAALNIILKAPEFRESESSLLQEYALLAVEQNHKFAVREIRAVIEARDERVPETVSEYEAGSVDLADMLVGTATIVVDQGIRIRGGVGFRDRVIGSGFFIDKRGYLMTNYHVIRSQVDPSHDGFSRLYIRTSDSPNSRIPARVVGYDQVLDVALLKAEVEPDYVFSLTDVRALRPGSTVYAMGSPGGLSSSISSGIISATGRRYLQLGEAMQIDAALNPGNSGGPVVHADGTLVGVAFAGIPQFENVNFAVPSLWIQHLLPRLYEEGAIRHPWMGLGVHPRRDSLEVSYVLPQSSAAEAGLRVEDRITAIDGVPVSELAPAQDLLMGVPVGTVVAVAYERAGQSRQTLVYLDERPNSPVEHALNRDIETSLFAPLFGMRVQELSSGIWRRDFRIESVYSGSVADETGLSAQDPFTLQDWIVDTDRRVVVLRISIRQRKAGFITRGIQLIGLLDPDNFI